jgi:phospholipid/cholesterol/gamma-HCH transport system substrate-binding protein
MARQETVEVLTGAAVLIVAAGFLAFAVAHSGRTERAGYKLYAQFDHIDGLSPGADVRIAGVKVGSVLDTRIDPKTFLAKVTLSVTENVKLPKDTSAGVTSESLLGGKFLNLEPGGDAKDIEAGGTITITQSSISLEQLLGKFIFSAASLTDKAKAASPAETGAGAAAPKPAPENDQGAPK